MKVSVILPSLNVEKYIRECVDSVRNQTLRDIEIICVDAGSTDGTLEILREYEKKDSRIRVMVSERKSYGYQMNLGISVAGGEYIGIVETDDYVPREMYEELYRIASENDVDFVKADFYRFTGTGATLSRAHYKLTDETSFYHKVINIKHHQNVFCFVMNTWSGIYKRDFLEKNDIRHNETPGASFQDNGFWFQTFMYSERAYFSNQPYYMNRRDNEGSSVFSKEKVYCICDEYQFIYDMMSRKRELMEDYGFIFAKACFNAYKGNLNRIADEYKKDFIMRWSEDFKRYRSEGLLDWEKFSETDWEMMLDIINDPEEYYERTVLEENLFYKTVRKQKNIIIYGAGMMGRRVLDKLVYCENPADVLCFAVSRLEENFHSYKNVEISDIHELLDYKEKGFVVIGTTALYQEEIAAMLSELGFLHVLAVPDQVKKDEKFYQDLSGERRKEELKLWYRRVTGEVLHLDAPVSFNEKQQCRKLGNIPELKKQLSDLVFMREWAAEKIGLEALPDVYGIYDRTEEVPYEELPDKFRIKCTHGRGIMATVLDKNNREQYRWEVISRRLNKALTGNYAYRASMELWYESAVPRLMVELPVEGMDYHDSVKTICQNGKVLYFVADQNTGSWDAKKRNIYDRDWNLLPVRMKYPNAREAVGRPVHFNEMVRMSETLSEEFDFAVVHFWDTPSKVVFNKICFEIGGGVERISCSYL